MYSERYGRERATKVSSIAKLVVSESTLKICDELISIYGGYGYTTDSLDINMLWRDAKGLTIVEGTNDIQKLIIQHEVKKEMS
jgi:alkylation response protein AidB-like acyl-CoA dehydrogenase